MGFENKTWPSKTKSDIGPLNRGKYTDTDGETKNKEVTCSKTAQVRVPEKCKTIFNLLLHVVELIMPTKKKTPCTI